MYWITPFLLTLWAVAVSIWLLRSPIPPNSKGRYFSGRFLFLSFGLVATISTFPFYSDGYIRLKTGVGPDTAQNLMAALRLSDSKNSFEELQGELSSKFSNNIDPLTNINILENLRDQALFDYTVTGFRYPSTSVISNILNLIPTHNLFLLQLIFFLLCQLLIVLSIFSVLRKTDYSHAKLIILSFSIPLNPLVVIQFMNGAWSQTLALPFIIFLTSSCINRAADSSDRGQSRVDSLLASLSFVLATLFYIESLVITLPIFIYFSFILIRRTEKQVTELAKTFAYLMSPFIAFLPFLTAIQLKISLGLSGYSGTGVSFAASPSFIDLMTPFRLNADWILNEGKFHSSLFFLMQLVLVVLYYIYNKIDIRKFLSSTSLSFALVSLFLSFTISLLSIFEIISSYLSIKVLTFLFIIFVVSLSSLTETSSKFLVRNTKLKKNLFRIGLSMISINSIIGIGIANQAGASWPASQFSNFQIQTVQRELSAYPYVTTYIGSSSWFGLFGDFNWIAKSPNQMKFSNRFRDLEMIRGICFTSDPNCKPATNELLRTPLSDVGFKVWQTDLNLGQFLELNSTERFDFVFETTGQSKFVVPTR